MVGAGEHAHAVYVCVEDGGGAAVVSVTGRVSHVSTPKIHTQAFTQTARIF